MSKIVLSLMLVFCVGLNTASARDGGKAKQDAPEQPASNVTKANAATPAATPAAKKPCCKQPVEANLPRKRMVYRLQNAPALDVANAINQFLRSERQIQQAALGAIGPFQRIESEVVVVPEDVSNSVIISATPRFFDDLMELVEKLDQRPPMVRIEILIAEVALNDAEKIEGDSEPGQGGLARLAWDKDVKARIRALQESGRLKTLSRPQIVTLDNQPAFIHVGQRVPTFRGKRSDDDAQIGSIVYENVGLMLGVTSRISPDGTVVMEIDAERSQLRPIEDSIAVAISTTGEVIRSPQIDTTSVQTTISTTDGETIVLGGLITRSKSTLNETLIVLTPHILSNEKEAKAAE